MICAWNDFLAILPPWLRRELGVREERELTELRIRAGKPPELCCNRTSRFLQQQASCEDIQLCINTASQYSPWASGSMARGYLTAQGGHRIGIGGQAVCKGGVVTGFRNIRSVCIRVARDFPGIADALTGLSGSVLIIGPPGRGKTTLLRDLIRQLSESGEHVCVVDERQELFPEEFFHSGSRTDVLTGLSKADGTELALRCMGPSIIAVDEITAQEDCMALLRAANCGVRLLATAHCTSFEDLHRRPVYQPLVEQKLFDYLVVILPDRSWSVERMIR